MEPPALDLNDEMHPIFSIKYQSVPVDLLPRSESLKMTVKRVVPYWTDVIEPSLKDGKKTIVVAHGNSLRALVKHFTGMDDS